MKKKWLAICAILLALVAVVAGLSVRHERLMRKRAEPVLVADDRGVWIVDALAPPELVYTWQRKKHMLHADTNGYSGSYRISDGFDVYEVLCPLDREHLMIEENPNLLPDLGTTYDWKAPKGYEEQYPETLQPHRLDQSFRDYELVYLDENGGLHARNIDYPGRTTIDADAGLCEEDLLGLERYGNAFVIECRTDTRVYYPYINSSGILVWIKWDLP